MKKNQEEKNLNISSETETWSSLEIPTISTVSELQSRLAGGLEHWMWPWYQLLGEIHLWSENGFSEPIKREGWLEAQGTLSVHICKNLLEAIFYL